MKLLLDECVDGRLAAEFPNTFEVETVRRMGWPGTKNGDLLQLAAAADFDAFLTIDAKIEFEQNPDRLPIAIVLLRAHPNNLEDLQSLIPKVLSALSILRDNSEKKFVKVKSDLRRTRQ